MSLGKLKSLSPGSDYEDFMGPVVFSGSQAIITIPIIDDNVNEFTETFGVRLSSTSPDVMVTGQDFATVTITDSDSKLYCLISYKHVFF